VTAIGLTETNTCVVTINIKGINTMGRYLYAVLRRIYGFYVSKFDGNFKNDPNYNLQLIAECFIERHSECYDSDLFKRICTSYNKAKIAQKDADTVYQVGNEWAPIYKKYMSEIMEVLKVSDFASMSRIYNNFMRESCSAGLHGIAGYERMTDNYFSGDVSLANARIYMKDVVYRYNIWNVEMGKDYDMASLKGPLLGNPYGHYVDGVFLESGSHYNHYYATKINNLLKGIKHSSVLELGGGYGKMAYYLMRDSKNITYLDFDLPENYALTAFYLLSAFPNKKIALYGEVDLERDDLKDYDAILMPNFEIDKMSANSIDLVFNSYSLAEMEPKAINNYINIINRVSKKYIYHLNHTKYCAMSANDFLIDMNKFEIVRKAPALWNKAINLAMDEFEFLYKTKH